MGSSGACAVQRKGAGGAKTRLDGLRLSRRWGSACLARRDDEQEEGVALFSGVGDGKQGSS